jgi:hypothetical protein
LARLAFEDSPYDEEEDDDDDEEEEAPSLPFASLLARLPAFFGPLADFSVFSLGDFFGLAPSAAFSLGAFGSFGVFGFFF